MSGEGTGGRVWKSFNKQCKHVSECSLMSSGQHSGSEGLVDDPSPLERVSRGGTAQNSMKYSSGMSFQQRL